MHPQSERDEIRHHADAFEAELRDQPAISMGVSCSTAHFLFTVIDSRPAASYLI